MAVSFWKRQTQGTAFLSLEHVAHMATVVITAVLTAAAANWLIVSWWGQSWSSAGLANHWPMLDLTGWLMGMPYSAVGLAAALLMFSFMLWFLGSRTKSEWGKRLGYTKRTAYKVPIYTAMGILGLISFSAKIVMLAVLLTSISWLGMANAPDQTNMYALQFLPALVTAVVASATFWHLVKMAKGHDKTMNWGMMKAALGVVLAVAMLVTYAVNLRQPTSDRLMNPAGTMLEGSDSSNFLDDLYRY